MDDLLYTLIFLIKAVDLISWDQKGLIFDCKHYSWSCSQKLSIKMAHQNIYEIDNILLSYFLQDHEKEEGEMSAESDYDDDHRRNKDRKRAPSSPSKKNSSSSLKKTSDSDHEGEIDDGGKGRANGNSEKREKSETRNDDDGSDVDPEEREKRNREERIQASLRKREEEVAKELSGHLHAREKEREQHRRSEAISAFQALLTDLIKHPDYSWKEAKKIFKKDSRYVNLFGMAVVRGITEGVRGEFAPLEFSDSSNFT